MHVDFPAVTIGIPFFNAQDTLLDAVRSVFAQTHTNWELILIDDGSRDRSLELARSLVDPRVRVISDGTNRGLPARLNQIVALARHDFIARMDADDLMSRDRVERQLRCLMTSPETDLVSAGVVSVSDGWNVVGTRCAAVGGQPSPRSVLSCQSGIVHAAILGRRAWFARNPYDETLRSCEDGELWIRARARGDLAVRILPAPLYYYREDGNVVPRKLLASYRVQRRAIAAASSGYALGDRVLAWAKAWGKTMTVRVLSMAGRMDILRQRRNAAQLDADARAAFEREIAAIRSIALAQRS